MCPDIQCEMSGRFVCPNIQCERSGQPVCVRIFNVRGLDGFLCPSIQLNETKFVTGDSARS